jgi:hypothetical protein
MCFGGSDDSSSRMMVEMQEQEAQEARDKETKRQARLDAGLKSIKSLFHGGDLYGIKAGTPASTAAATTKQVWVPASGGGGSANTTKGGSYGTNASGTGSQNISQRGTGGGSSIQGVSAGGASPSGYWQTVTVPGATTAATGDETVVTGTSAGIGDDFYNKFKQGILDYYNPQVKEKYGEAQDQLTYNTARAGQLRSDVAASELAKLVKQNELRTAEVGSKADTAAGDLKSRAASEENKAIAQLYATENPEVAANQATESIRDVTSETPDLTPLGAIFDIASFGGAGYMKGAQNAEYLKRIGALPKAGQSTTIV